MKKLFKILLILLGIAAAGAVGFALFVQFSGIPTYPPIAYDLKVEVTPERVAHGEKLAATLCRACHYSQETKKLTGTQMMDLPTAFGTANSLNITQHPEAGIGKWTDGELFVFLRTGIRKDGRWSPPWMPKFSHASNEDILSMIAFLRSDNELVQAATPEPPPGELSWLAKFLCRFVFKAPAFRDKIPQPDTTNTVAWGKYLATNLYDCFACHSASFETMNQEEPEKSAGFFGGGNEPLNMEGKPMKTPNITFDEETGIGKWSQEEFITAVKWGKSPNGVLRYPMEPYSRLDTAEVVAIYEYLKTVPKIKNKVPRNP